MKKLKIYLDTSVISMLDDSPRGIITKGFFEYITKNNCEIVVSIVVENEIHKTESPKKESVLFFMKQIEFTKIPYCDESNILAWKYVMENVLTHNHFDDLSHVAYATVHECDMIVSWNRKHIAKPAKIKKINLCNIKYNYRSITICTPEEFLTVYQ